jgi:hypothetical protein
LLIYRILPFLCPEWSLPLSKRDRRCSVLVKKYVTLRLPWSEVHIVKRPFCQNSTVTNDKILILLYKFLRGTEDLQASDVGKDPMICRVLQTVLGSIKGVDKFQLHVGRTSGDYSQASYHIGPGPIPGHHVTIVVDKVALRQVFSHSFRFPCRLSFHRMPHTHLSSGAGTTGQLVAGVPSASFSLHLENKIYCDMTMI